jgi:hypothetical protein
MFIGITYQIHKYSRCSKNGLQHTYSRKLSIVEFRCDNCNEIFTRSRGKMDPKRLSNNYFHVCSSCDAKRFAQRKRVDKSKIWDMKASSLEDISKL